VALAWDSHVHHAAVREWFATSAGAGWATCPITESGFVRVSSNPRVLPSPVSVEQARGVLRTLRALQTHRFLTDDVSLADPEIPPLAGYRQITDAHLLAIARRHETRLVTFDAAAARLAHGGEVQLLTALG
jgi:toxin-antitoxin system PIN domain toxin